MWMARLAFDSQESLLRRKGRVGGRLGLGRILLLRRPDDGVENGAFHTRHELDHSGIADVLDQLVDDRIAQLAMGHLPATKAQAGLDLVAIHKEAHRLILLCLVIVLVHGDGEFDLFDDDHLLFFLGGAFALFFFVEEAAVILDAADWGNCVGRHLDQIKTPFAGDFERLKRRQNAELFAVFVDDANLARANPVVDADKGLCRTFIECDGAPPKVASARLRGLPESPRVDERTLSIALAWLSGTKGL